jgi:hypothetical protein
MQWPTNSLQLGDGAQGLDGPDGGDPHGIPPASRGDSRLGLDAPAAVLRLFVALLPQVFAPATPVGRRLPSWTASWWPPGLPPRMRRAADGVAWDEPIRQSIADAFASAGGLVGHTDDGAVPGSAGRLPWAGRGRATDWG